MYKKIKNLQELLLYAYHKIPRNNIFLIWILKNLRKKLMILLKKNQVKLKIKDKWIMLI